MFLSLKQKYRDFNKELGQTGAGLQVEDIRKDSSLHNLVGRAFFLEQHPESHDRTEQLSANFPYWERLHGFW